MLIEIKNILTLNFHQYHQNRLIIEKKYFLQSFNF